MESLPKIARERLQASSLSDHPDADLLNAFAERCLTDPERAQVADHLSRCGECRQVLVIASSAADVALPPAPKWKSIPHRTTGLFSWPALRWGSVAACVVVLSATALLVSRRTSHQAPGQIASNAQPQKAQNMPAEPQASEELDVTAAQSTRTPAPRQSDALSANEKLRASAKLPASIESRKKFVTLPDERASKDAAALLALAPGVSDREEAYKSLSAPAAEAASRPDASQGSIAQATPSAASQLAKDGQTTDQKASAASAHANADKSDQLNRPQVSSEMVEVTAGTVQTETATVASKPIRTAKAEAKSNAGFAAGRSVNGIAATAATTSGGPLMHDVTSAKWTLSPDGLPQRSFDSGRTWEKMQVDHHTGFRALSAQGMDVWVGGLAGVLYHSSDIGMHWKRIIPVTESNTLASDILTLDFRDPLHGKLTTANQESWSTSDGGKTWQKQP